MIYTTVSHNLLLYHMIQFIKDVTLHHRNVTTLLCQVISPIVIISVAGFLQVIRVGLLRMVSLCVLQMLFDVIIDNYDNAIPGSGQTSIYSGKMFVLIISILLLSTVAYLQMPHGW